MWTPPATRDPGTLLDEVIAQLAAYGARGWQIALTAPLLTDAVLGAEAQPAGVEAGVDAGAETVAEGEADEDDGSA
jgi:ribonuclease D